MRDRCSLQSTFTSPPSPPSSIRAAIMAAAAASARAASLPLSEIFDAERRLFVNTMSVRDSIGRDSSFFSVG